METIALFPLNVVLFPGGQLPLRIFEPRYVDLVSECLRTDAGFGVCLIKDGSEAGGGARCHQLGTYARIIDWNQLEDGLLGIVVEAGARFKVEHFAQRSNNLLLGDVEWLEEDETYVIGQDYSSLKTLLRRIFEHYQIPFESDAARFDDPNWLAYRLSELLPLDTQTKQSFLEISDSRQRLAELERVVNQSDYVEIGD